MGIYRIPLNDIRLNEVKPLGINDTTGVYDVAHPFVSGDGALFFFSSNMPGGFGGKDLYMCKRRDDGTWENPVNMGPRINSDFDEISPSLSVNGYLYYSSNRERGNYDIYEVDFSNREFGAVEKMGEPLNSDKNDFGLVFDGTGKVGLFTSDRLSNLDIYKLYYDFPRFENCEPVHETNFCFLFEDLSVQTCDTLPFRFEWDFGDGNKAHGLAAEHCYENIGNYRASLSVIDTITNLAYAKVSEIDVAVEKFRRPFIQSSEIAYVGDTVSLFSSMANMNDFEPNKYYWFLGDGKKECIENVHHIYQEPGIYSVTLGVESIFKNGIVEKVCSTKQLYIVDAIDTSLIVDEKEDEKYMEVDVIQNEFFVELTKSESSLSLSDTLFSTVNYEITERFQKETKEYMYTVGNAPSYIDLYDLYYEMRNIGFSNSIVREQKIDNPHTVMVKKGWYVSDSSRKAIHTSIYKFKDILFENNSDDLLNDSKILLEQIAKVMENEIHFKIEIVAHTDNVGNDLYNMDLSTKRAVSVKNYLIKLGIDENRLTSKGMGEIAPISSNETEAGRGLNRRVEFLLFFENMNGELEFKE